MIHKILNQIENINNALTWIRKNKSNDYQQKFKTLVDERRKLRKLYLAYRDNPAIAAYGVSQVGKSYLMNCILQNDGKPYLVEADGRTYNFIEEMNPKTDNTEATGVVTRFSSFSRDKDKYSKDYPILMRCLSVADVVMVISDGYYNDISDYTTYSEAEISKKTDELLSKYENHPVIPNSPITADDILDIRGYYQGHVNNAQAFLHTSFFDILALIADKIPDTEWVGVFSILWHESEYQTKLFAKMLSTLSKLEYSEYVYLPAQAMLHNGNNEDTVMSVQCLNELFLETPRFFTDAYVRHGDSYTQVPHLTKSEVSAVCAEIIMKIGDEYLDSKLSYCFANIKSQAVKDILKRDKVRVERPNTATQQSDEYYETSISLLRNNDMLDFPGARSRKKELLATLCEDAILINVLLRGKVAYLFNMYNEAMLINVLLYCHHAAQNDVTDVPLLLNSWISNYVGKTTEQRCKRLELTDGISPLFYIGTKFNMDMERKPEDIANERNAINGRWQQRFEKVLYHQCFNADGSLGEDNNKIFLNWTRPGECFNNSYILRDFKFSGPLTSKLYEGERTNRCTMTISQEYYDEMRESFCSNDIVRRFFKNPELSWDVCASINNDGALYIIEQLSRVAEKLDYAREELFKDMLNKSTGHILRAVEGYFVSTDVSELLDSNIKKAREIFREMDFACNSDNYYFGHLVQALQMTESESYRVIHRIVQNPELIQNVTSFKDYEVIRNSCQSSGFPLENVHTEEEKWKCIMQTYGFGTREEAEEFLLHKGIDIKKLFSGAFKQRQNSSVIADAIYEEWCASIKSVDFMRTFTGENGFDSTVMSNLIDSLISSGEILKLRDKMAEAIAEHVNVINISVINESLVADTLVGMINEFVTDFGFSLLTGEEKLKAKSVCEKFHLPAFNYILKTMPSVYEEAELTALFNDMSSSPTALLPSFEDNYNRWREYMFISFVSHLNVPDFDYQANLDLKALMDKIKSDKENA